MRVTVKLRYVANQEDLVNEEFPHNAWNAFAIIENTENEYVPTSVYVDDFYELSSILK